MGQAIGSFFGGGLTNPNSATIDPQSGQMSAVNPKLFAQIRDQGAVDRSAQSIAPQPGAPQMTVDQSGQPQFSSPDNARATYQPPDLVTPSFQDALHMGAAPGGVNALSPGLSKGGKLVAMLSSGLQGALAGRAASEQATVASGGRRSGGVGMGMEAGYQLPFLRALQAQQVQQAQAVTAGTQAETAGTQAKTGLTEAQTNLYRTSVPVTLPNGQQVFIPANQIGQYMRGGAAAQTGAQAKIQATQLQNRYKITPQGLYDTQNPDANGNPKLIPNSGKGTALTPELAQQLNIPEQYIGQVMSLADLNAAESRMLAQQPKTTTREDVQTDGNGNLVRVPVTSTTTPGRLPFLGPGSSPMPTLAPGAAGSPGAAQRGGGRAATPVTGAGGVPVQSGAGAKNNRSWVTWQEPSGRTVAGPLSMAQQMGAQNPAAVDTRDVQAINDSRQAVNLINKQSADPASMGVMQLINGLDKDGKLGIAASRLNSFLAGGVGTLPGDDPRIMSLLDKSQLAMTLVMKAHFGASGGRSPQMLDHFLSMANAKKMDGGALRAGFGAIGDYMNDRAMIPGQAGGAPNQGGGGGAPTHAVIVNGRTVGYTADGKTMTPAPQ